MTAEEIGAASAPARILGIVGSLRRDSVNRRLLDAAGRLMPELGATLTAWDGLATVPAFNEDDEGAAGPAVVGLRRAISAADGVLVVTPEYNSSMPGQLKNALDWASRPYQSNVFRGRPVAVIGASPSPGGSARAQAHARQVLTTMGARVIEKGLAVPHAFGQFDGAGELADPGLRGELEAVLRDLRGAAVSTSERVAA